jgi:hypothetical protein
MKVCKICSRKPKRWLSLGMCEKHYARNRKFGNPYQRTIFTKNKITFLGDIFEMELYDRSGNVKAVTKFDKDIYSIVRKYKWGITSFGYVATHHKKYCSPFFLHHLVVGQPLSREYVVDHIDRDKLNNLKSNLRIITRRENLCNNSGKGYFFNSKAKRYIVVIGVGGKSVYGGCYQKEEDAENKVKELNQNLRRGIKFYKE